MSSSKDNEFKEAGILLQTEYNNLRENYQDRPEDHPSYSDEWEKYWARKSEEVTRSGGNELTYDYLPGWNLFWRKRVDELLVSDFKFRMEILRLKFRMPEPKEESPPRRISMEDYNRQNSQSKLTFQAPSSSSSLRMPLPTASTSRMPAAPTLQSQHSKPDSQKVNLNLVHILEGLSRLEGKYGQLNKIPGFVSKHLRLVETMERDRPQSSHALFKNQIFISLLKTCKDSLTRLMNDTTISTDAVGTMIKSICSINDVLEAAGNQSCSTATASTTSTPVTTPTPLPSATAHVTSNSRITSTRIIPPPPPTFVNVPKPNNYDSSEIAAAIANLAGNSSHYSGPTSNVPTTSTNTTTGSSSWRDYHGAEVSTGVSTRPHNNNYESRDRAGWGAYPEPPVLKSCLRVPVTTEDSQGPLHHPEQEPPKKKSCLRSSSVTSSSEVLTDPLQINSFAPVLVSDSWMKRIVGGDEGGRITRTIDNPIEPLSSRKEEGPTTARPLNIRLEFQKKRDHDESERSKSISSSRRRSEETSSSSKKVKKDDLMIKPPVRPGFISVCSTTLWIGHFAKGSVTEADLLFKFRLYGEVLSLDFILSRGCAYVVMCRRKDACLALEQLQGTTAFGGKPLKVCWATGRGMKGQEWKEYWDANAGVSFIPWSKLQLKTNLEDMLDGGCIEEDSLPFVWKVRYKTILTKKMSEIKRKRTNSIEEPQLKPEEEKLSQVSLLQRQPTRPIKLQPPLIMPPASVGQPPRGLPFPGFLHPGYPLYMPPGYGMDFLRPPLSIPVMSISSSGATKPIARGNEITSEPVSYQVVNEEEGEPCVPGEETFPQPPKRYIVPIKPSDTVSTALDGKGTPLQQKYQRVKESIEKQLKKLENPKQSLARKLRDEEMICLPLQESDLQLGLICAFADGYKPSPLELKPLSPPLILSKRQRRIINAIVVKLRESLPPMTEEEFLVFKTTLEAMELEKMEKLVNELKEEGGDSKADAIPKTPQKLKAQKESKARKARARKNKHKKLDDDALICIQLPSKFEELLVICNLTDVIKHDHWCDETPPTPLTSSQRENLIKKLNKLQIKPFATTETVDTENTKGKDSKGEKMKEATIQLTKSQRYRKSEKVWKERINKGETNLVAELITARGYANLFLNGAQNSAEAEMVESPETDTLTEGNDSGEEGKLVIVTE